MKPPLESFHLERYFAQWEFRAKYLLSASDCESMSIQDVLDIAGEPVSSLAALRLGYTESQGDPALRRAIARYHQSIKPEQIVLTNAPEEAIFLAMMALLRTGDRVIVQVPCYQSLRALAVYHQCQVVPWPMRETDSGWRMDLDHLETLLAEPTRLLVVNSPHNPTGYLPSLDEFETIIRLAGKHGTWLFSDEMYRGLEYEGTVPLPPASDAYAKAVSLWGMSKSFGLPGLRIGWLSTQDAELIDSLLAIKDYTTICASAPGEFLARLALENGQALFDRNKTLIGDNLARVVAFHQRWAGRFAWRQPVAGSVAFARLLGEPADRFCARLVQEAGVLLVPSTLFDFGNSHLRWGLGRKGFDAGLEALEDTLNRLGPQ